MNRKNTQFAVNPHASKNLMHMALKMGQIITLIE